MTWSYDNQNQLTSENRTGTNAYRQTYTYDVGGNRTLKNIDGTRTTYSYDDANQLKYGQTATGRTTYVYDPNGKEGTKRGTKRCQEPFIDNLEGTKRRGTKRCQEPFIDNLD